MFNPELEPVEELHWKDHEYDDCFLCRLDPDEPYYPYFTSELPSGYQGYGPPQDEDKDGKRN